jgi:hypothetical protein
MPNRYAVPVNVAQLRQKLNLLYDSGRVYTAGRVDGDAALGRLFKSPANPNRLSGKTIRLWEDGEGG